ncbi:cobalamin (vitamin B12) biosynthesis CbiM protein [Pyrodictium delaneyi]|uniref:Cobalamin (Vitamin B12) biosynthesis CbiM protein n=1 Tax=Pyrodictium delaneyi TaxID=1273541 RepID=A0A0N7JD90_9CREN|nr:energy-coupling factor ABC transporter permease [Pyrodictium delaneyi]ALL01529.1 cobalamin (vitamin B12) biosynthesis CbiM protein [Pyrodictium delaneyi]OWJ54568.1 metal transporter [Pyrodictium delaneyi]
MHIPDGFLDPFWIMVTYAATIAYAVVAWSKIKGRLTQEQIISMSVLAAGIFVAQMLNWPLPGGTSLHFVGGALAGILFGPWLGFYVMALVLVVQTLVFHDGGITALGANIFNMAVVDVVVGYYLYRAAIRAMGETRKARLIGAFLGGWLGIVLAGLAAGLEIGLSPSFPYGVEVSVPVMVTWHAVLGVIEGLITALVVDYLYQRKSPIIEAAAKVAVHATA